MSQPKIVPPHFIASTAGPVTCDGRPGPQFTHSAAGGRPVASSRRLRLGRCHPVVADARAMLQAEIDRLVPTYLADHST
jgi:hypothetical protein